MSTPFLVGGCLRNGAGVVECSEVFDGEWVAALTAPCRKAEINPGLVTLSIDVAANFYLTDQPQPPTDFRTDY